MSGSELYFTVRREGTPEGDACEGRGGTDFVRGTCTSTPDCDGGTTGEDCGGLVGEAHT